MIPIQQWIRQSLTNYNTVNLICLIKLISLKRKKLLTFYYSKPIFIAGNKFILFKKKMFLV